MYVALTNIYSSPSRADSGLPSPLPESVRTVFGAYAEVITKFSRTHRFPYFFSYGAPLKRAMRARGAPPVTTSYYQ